MQKIDLLFLNKIYTQKNTERNEKCFIWSPTRVIHENSNPPRAQLCHARRTSVERSAACAFRARSATRAGNWIWHGGDNRRDSAALAACRFFGNRSAYAGDRRLIAADRCPCTEQYPHHCARCRAGHRTDDRGREPGWRAYFFSRSVAQGAAS